jgi:peptidylprolyl isomerase
MTQIWDCLLNKKQVPHMFSKFKKIVTFFLSLFSINTAIASTHQTEVHMSPNHNKCMVLTLKYGDVYIKFRDDVAPNHVARVSELAQQGFYNGVVFHRVIDGFMAQTGDPTGTGTGGSGKNIKAEFSKERHVRGTVSMARAASPDSADSQFFIVYAPAAYLDGQYTVFGEVVKGMEFVDMVKKGNPANNGSVNDPDKIIKAKIIDAAECERDTAQ